MAKKRKFCAYRALERPFTRKSKFRKKSFVRSSPVPKIVRFDMGNKTKQDWEYSIKLISKADLQIRDNAIESARQVSNKKLETVVGKENYHLRIRAYPHHMLRENPLASGAGADRMSTGMKMSFGKIIGIAVQVKKGKVMFEVKTKKEFVDTAKVALSKAATKMPSSFIIDISKIPKVAAKN
jgi:large subunit ribosomal protein L10e